MISNHSSFLPIIRSIQDKIPVQIRQPLYKFIKWQYLGISIIILATLVLHFIIINHPATTVFDEFHYVAEARSIIAGQGPLFVEHPPLAKLFIISGILIFGDNPFGWRFFSAIFGTISIILFYFICRRLEMPRGGPLLATFIFAFENLNFVQSCVAMLDVYMVTFMLAAFLLYLSRKAFSSGLFISLSIISKITGVFAAVSIGIDWLLDRNKNILFIIILGTSTLVCFGAIFTVLSSVVLGQLMNPVELIKYMYNQSSNITFSVVYQQSASTPWEWIFLPTFIFYSYEPQLIAMISLTVWVVMIPMIIYMIWLAFHKDRASIWVLSWFAGTYLTLLPLVLITNRVTFLYYFYPTLGAVCIGIGICLSRLWKYWENNNKTRKGQAALVLSSGYVFLHIVVFVLFSPVGVPFVRWLPL